MKQKFSVIRITLAVAAGLAVSAVSSHAQNVNVTGTLTDVPLGGGVYDYTLTLHNVGPEPVTSLWFGWKVGNFNIANPTSPGNLQAWTSTPVSSSVQYGGSPATEIPSGGFGVFTVDSTSTPAQFMAGTSGASVAYGVNAQQFGIFNTTLDSELFNPSLAPEPSTFSMVAVGSFVFLGALGRKLRS